MAGGKTWKPVLLHAETYKRLQRLTKQEKLTYTEAIARLLEEHEERASTK